MSDSRLSSLLSKLWENKSIVLLGGLYLSLVGYFYDYVYYELGYGISIIHFADWNDLAFSVLKSWLLAGFIFIVSVLIWFIFHFVTQYLWKATYANIKLKEAFSNLCEKSKSIFDKPLENAEEELTTARGSKERIICFFKLNSLKIFSSVIKIIVGALVWIAKAMVWIAKAMVWIAVQAMKSKIIKLLIYLLVLVLLLIPFEAAYLTASVESRSPSGDDEILCVSSPVYCLENFVNVGVLGEYAIFTRKENKGQVHSPRQYVNALEKQMKALGRCIETLWSGGELCLQKTVLKTGVVMIPHRNLALFGNSKLAFKAHDNDGTPYVDFEKRVKKVIQNQLQPMQASIQGNVNKAKDEVMDSIQTMQNTMQNKTLEKIESVAKIPPTRQQLFNEIKTNRNVLYEVRNFPFAKLTQFIAFERDHFELSKVQKDKLIEFHEEMSKCGSGNYRPKIAIRGLASPESYICNSNKKNCELANKRMRNVAEKLLEINKTNKSIEENFYCTEAVMKDASAIHCDLKKYDLYLLPWANYSDLEKGMIKAPNSNPLNLVNRGVQLIIEDLGSCQIGRE